MKLIYVNFERINVRNYLNKERSAVFEIVVDDTYNKEVWNQRFNIDKALTQILKFVIKKEELKHAKLDEEVKVIIQDKEFVKKAIKEFILEIDQLTGKLNKNNPDTYLDTLSRINRLSLNFNKKIKEIKSKEEDRPHVEDWKEKLSKTRLSLGGRKE